MTLLLLVARVFAVMEKVVKGIHIFIIALFIAYVPIQLVKTFACSPIPAYWDPSIIGSGVDTRKVFVFDLSLAILTEFAILVLPIPLTWSLSFSWKKKVKIGVLLGAGGAAVAVTTYRSLDVSYSNLSGKSPCYRKCSLLLLQQVSRDGSWACMRMYTDYQRPRRASATTDIKLPSESICRDKRYRST